MCGFNFFFLEAFKFILSLFHFLVFLYSILEFLICSGFGIPPSLLSEIFPVVDLQEPDLINSSVNTKVLAFVP